MACGLGAEGENHVESEAHEKDVNDDYDAGDGGYATYASADSGEYVYLGRASRAFVETIRDSCLASRERLEQPSPEPA